MDPETFYDRYIGTDFEERYVPQKFEEICRQYLIRQNLLGNIVPVIEKIGKYYYDDPQSHSNGEFDVVSRDENGYVFYEVKFRKRKISKEIIDEEISQVKKTGLDCYKYVFFSRSGFPAFCEKRICAFFPQHSGIHSVLRPACAVRSGRPDVS